MPDVIEENEGEGGSAIARRAHAMVLARAAAAAARVANNNNNVNAVVAVLEGNAAVPPAANAREAANAMAAVSELAAHLARLSGVNVRPMFSRLGVRSSQDVRYIREKDLDGLPRITPIQKRKVWAVLKYVATENPPLTARTSLAEIARTLNANKKRDKESTSNSTSTALTCTGSSMSVPMIQISKLETFDGSHSRWIHWKNKSFYGLAQTNLGPLLEEGSVGLTFAKKNPGLDHLLFNLLAEALVSGSAKHLIHETEQKVEEVPPVAAAANNNIQKPKRNSSGRVLWHSLREEYSQGPMAFWILSDARQTLQKLHLVRSQSVDPNNQFVSCSAHDYVNRFRGAKDTLAEYKQALPDPFLASTFVEHVYDDRLEAIKKQLLHDVSTKGLSLDDCIKELLMSDHMLRVRRQSKEKRRENRKRVQPDEPEQEEDGKRQKPDDEKVEAIEKEEMIKEPDESTS